MPNPPSSTTRADKPVAWLWIQMILDSVAWIVALWVAVLLRFELDVELVSVGGVVVTCVVAVALQLLVGFSFALYKGRYSFGSFDEAKLLVVVTVIVTALLEAMLLVFGVTLWVPRSLGFIAFPFACLLMAAFRYLKRMYQESTAKPGDEAQHVVIFGAGALGTFLVHRMMQDPASGFLPVALLDDDPAKKHLRISSVPVMGTLHDAASVLEHTRAGVLIVALSDADPRTMQRVSDAVEGTGTRVMTVPPLSEMLAGGNQGMDLRDISMEDLIGRRPVDIHVDAIAGYVTGKRVLVTGAGGSIGSELCRQLVGFEPAELIMVDRDETGLQTTQISITGRGLLDGNDTVLCDIRDADALQKVFDERRPQVVFHAAALKHVSLLEQYPDEAWKTNVMGSLHVLDAAAAVGVDVFVNVSTDKAANPTTALGHSKRVAEKLTAWTGERTGKRYASVRFGNVFGSRGSMLPLFAEQIRQGGPITVTHPDATRYFMTIPEACQLVIQAGAIARGGEVLILDMGEPVRIMDIAQRLRAMSGRKDIEIEITGLRHGEKLHEDLIGTGETDERPFHPKISHAKAERLDPANLDRHVWKVRGGMMFTGSIPQVVVSTQPKITSFPVPRASERTSSRPGDDAACGEHEQASVHGATPTNDRALPGDGSGTARAGTATDRDGGSTSGNGHTAPRVGVDSRGGGGVVERDTALQRDARAVEQHSVEQHGDDGRNAR